MNNLLFRIVSSIGLIMILGSMTLRPALAFTGEQNIAGSSAVVRTKESEYNQTDKEERYLKLFLYLKAEKSPLAEYSWNFIDSADRWDIDWRLLPAITGIESNFGKRMVDGTHNAYGWAGGYLGFEGWQESIEHVSSQLRLNYYNRGYDNALKIGPIYAPPNPRWGGIVDSLMRRIDES